MNDLTIEELSKKVNHFLIPNSTTLKYSGCIKRGMSDENLKEMGQFLDQLWEKVGRDNSKLNPLIRRNYECLSYEIREYRNFDRNW